MTASRDESFVPLAATARAKPRREDFRVLVAERPENARPLVTALASAEGSPGGPRPGCEPQVTLHREGDCVTGIQIRCSCGQLIELKCAYEPNPPATPNP